jgi:hypothetical protein
MTNSNTVLAPSETTRLEPLRPMPLYEVQRAMQEYQSGLQAILDPTDWQTFVDRRDGSEKHFVKRSGWRKVGTWFGLNLEIDVPSIVIERDESDQPLRVRLVGRAVAPNGRIAEDVGACSITERRFSKPDHDLLATAATRALNRATSNLVGMGELTAEEIDDSVGGVLLPEWAQMADDTNIAATVEKLVALLGVDRANALMRALDGRYDGVPNIATGLVNALHSMLADELATARTPKEN